MKAIEKFGGQALSREQQKQITGGLARVVCVCDNGTAFICLGNPFSCSLDGIEVCGGNASCIIS